MFRNRLLKLVIALGLGAILALTLWSAVARSAVVSDAPTQKDPSDYALRQPGMEPPALKETSISLSRVRSMIPSEFIQPVVPDAVDAEPEDFIQQLGTRTVRDMIPSEFFQPVAPHNVCDAISSQFILPKWCK